MKKLVCHSLLAGLFLSIATVSGLAGAQTSAPPAVVPPAPPIPFAAANLTPLGVRGMAANCAACHGTNGISAGGAIPSTGLAGGSKDYIVAQMKAFKDGKREATVMHQIAKGYSDAEIAALADFFAAQKK
jgi:cytochrome c553